MATNPRTSQLGQTGATTGQTVVWNGTAWLPANLTDPNAIPKTLIDAKGDLLIGSADNTIIRLPVGTDTYVLTADSAQPGGIRWAAQTGAYTDPLTTKGDLLGRTATTTVRIPVGADGKALIADSASTVGVSWGSAGVPFIVEATGVYASRPVGQIVVYVGHDTPPADSVNGDIWIATA